MGNTIIGASVWEQEVYDHLSSHVAQERDTLQAYERLAQSTDSEAFKYLAGLILDDERRHHLLLAELAETIRTSAELSRTPTPIPHLDFRGDREAILELTESFLRVEEQDNRDLERLARDLKDVRNTTMWELVLRLIQDDNAKHRRILTFIRDQARKKHL